MAEADPIVRLKLPGQPAPVCMAWREAAALIIAPCIPILARPALHAAHPARAAAPPATESGSR